MTCKRDAALAGDRNQAAGGLPGVGEERGSQLSPSSRAASHPVTVSGSLGSGRPGGDQVTSTSTAFVHTHHVAGLPAVVATTIPASKVPAS